MLRNSSAAGRWFAVSLLVVVLDQLTKYWIISVLRTHESVVITPFLDLVLVYNPGAAFSFLSRAAGWQRGFFIAIAALASIFIVYLIAKNSARTLFCFALSLVLGGALGNLIDRIFLGAVVDFLYFHVYEHYWPAFNVADSAISVGAALLVWDSFKKPEVEKPSTL